MTDPKWIILGGYVLLAGIVVLQQFHIHALVNKLLSRNFYEYQQAKQLGKPEMDPPKKETDVPEDLGYLRGFN